MASTTGRPLGQNVSDRVIEQLPEEAARHIPDVIQKQQRKSESPSLLSAAGWSAGATAAFNAPSVWKGRAKGLGLLASGGRIARNIGLGAAAGTAVTLPAEYLVGRASDKYSDDKKFDAGHFAAIAAPAVASGTIGTGAFLNTLDQMKSSGKIGTKQMVKNIISPRKVIHATGREFSNVGNLFKTKKFGSGLLAAGMLGLSAIEPIQYIMQTRNKKPLEKEASAKKSVRKALKSMSEKVKSERAKNRLVGIGAVAAGTYYGVDHFIEKRKKGLSQFKKNVHDTFGSPSLYN
jgi:hypothetical protein